MTHKQITVSPKIHQDNTNLKLHQNLTHMDKHHLFHIIPKQFAFETPEYELLNYYTLLLISNKTKQRTVYMTHFFLNV